MGILRNLQQAYANALWPSQFVAWIDAVSDFIDNFVAGGPQAETMYVSKAGSDATGNGSFLNPFLTIQKGISAAVAAGASAATPFAVAVLPGIYATAFVLKPFVFVVGMGRDVTTIQNASANWVDAAFAGAVNATTGIASCTISTSPVSVDFAAVGSTGAGIFTMHDLILADNAVVLTITGASISNQFILQNVQRIGSTTSATHVIKNLTAWLSDWFSLSDNVTLKGSLGVVNTHRVQNVGGGGQGTWTVDATGATAIFQVIFQGTSVFNPEGGLVITGDNAAVRGGASLLRSIPGPDANTTFDFNSGAVGSTKLVGGGVNLLTANPTANRVYTINQPSQQGTRIRIKNISAFIIDLVFVGGTNSLNPSYLAPGDYLDLFFDQVIWASQPKVQSGSVVLTNGASGNIVADITANSKITITWRTSNGAAGVPLIGTKTVGTRAGGGLFTFTSAALATGGTVATDQGTYDWHIAG